MRDLPIVRNTSQHRSPVNWVDAPAIHEDKASGVLAGRKGLSEALKGCAAGDVLVVWKLDRLARSLHDLVVIAADLKGREVGLKILTGEGAAVDTTHAQGRMVFGILAVMAEFERELMSERTSAGMKAAKRRGRHVGRPPKLTLDQLALARRLIDSDLETRAGAAALLKVGKSTLRRALNAPDGSGGTVAEEKRPASVRAGKRA